MRFFYVDPGLWHNLGHHANSCRYITRELRARGVETRVFAFAQVEPALRAELGAVPLFRWYTYEIGDRDPICGWLNSYLVGGQATREDLGRIPDVGPGDLLYLNSGQATQLFGLAQWLAVLPAVVRPRVAFEFGVDPGMDVQQMPGNVQLTVRDPRQDPRAVLTRHAGGQIPQAAAPRVHLATFEPNASGAYQALLGKPVTVLPLPRRAVTDLRSRAGRRPITVSVLGHQRGEKGYQHMPEVARRVLAVGRDVKLLAHNGAPGVMEQTQREMRALAAADSRLILDERVADDKIWAELLDASDLIVCPYNPGRFAISYSAVAAEAIANSIPLVVPAHTSMDRLMREFGGGGTTFERDDPPSIAEATLRAIDRFDEIAALAAAG
ncbi:MAG TPA: hypothetical protein VL371_00115, partial [Gemmataceae bacterium]|nr:hypothetical protein [Gemmataceae bacterium]